MLHPPDTAQVFNDGEKDAAESKWGETKQNGGPFNVSAVRWHKQILLEKKRDASYRKCFQDGGCNRLERLASEEGHWLLLQWTQAQFLTTSYNSSFRNSSALFWSLKAPCTHAGHRHILKGHTLKTNQSFILYK